MKAYTIPLTCPGCGGELDPVGESPPDPTGSSTTALAECDTCNTLYTLTVILRRKTSSRKVAA